LKREHKQGWLIYTSKLEPRYSGVLFQATVPGLTQLRL